MSKKPHVSAKPWPVIINVSLSNSEVRQILEKDHKVRVSDTTGEDTIIFPLSSVAFLLLELDRVMVGNGKGGESLDLQLIKRLERFHQIHRHCYVIVVSQMMASKQLESLVALQGRFLNLHMGFIPAHNPKEIIDCMISITKVTCKPLSQIIQDRLQNLQSSTLTESVVLHVLSNLGLTMHDILY
ncbi:uncharacterized protein C1orf146-like [Actinia tenebrosa]|uniref:Uncharacterized protein C1orf146-like n=1 Tax=Actinia tenebrosa TaxID=6105 RepID=A0A6P8IES5_ACTTE|nr:uncharacterized protein C1orf146-like [Actinia tenebrosa]